jgi:DNA polymerase elongation subunit (family B)
MEDILNKITEIINRVRCIHRHSVDEHPQCFCEGTVVDKRDEEEQKLKPWYAEEGLKIGYLDIEADALTADFGTMLTWCIKEKDGPIHSSIITKEELFTGVYDERLVRDLITKMSEFKILVGYYSGNYRYDLPFIRTKAMHYGIEFPGYELQEKVSGGTKYVAQMYHWDLYPVVKATMSLSRRSLDNATSYLGIKGKTPLDKDIWRAGKYGDPDAIAEILRHNEGDVMITEKLHEKLTKYYRWARSG